MWCFLVTSRIVFTRHDGGVSVCTPTDWAISVMSCGGLWDDLPPGYMNVQIERKISRGMPEDAALRYCRALHFGGCTTAEALEIIRDGDCFTGIAHELWDASDVPADRWFRGAWRRSRNGGPIWVDLEKSRPIQWQRLRDAKTDRESELTFRNFDPEPYRAKILSASSLEELRHIWPKELQ